MSTEPNAAPVDETAARFTDLVSDVWALRARVVDLRDLIVHFEVSPEAYKAIITLTADQRAALADLLKVNGPGVELTGIPAFPQTYLETDGRWRVVLKMEATR